MACALAPQRPSLLDLQAPSPHFLSPQPFPYLSVSLILSLPHTHTRAGAFSALPLTLSLALPLSSSLSLSLEQAGFARGLTTLTTRAAFPLAPPPQAPAPTFHIEPPEEEDFAQDRQNPDGEASAFDKVRAAAEAADQASSPFLIRGNVLKVLQVLRAPTIGGHWNLFCRKALLPFGSHDSPQAQR